MPGLQTTPPEVHTAPAARAFRDVPQLEREPCGACERVAAGVHRRRARVRVEDGLWMSFEHASFDNWWEPYTFGVGPAGVYVVSLDPEARDRLRELCRRRLPEAPFVVKARAWAARARV